MKDDSPLTQPIAWLPFVMSLMALALLLGYVAIFGIVHQQDEGMLAHLFQLILVAQLPIVAFFAIKWLPKRPRETLLVLALQAVAWMIPVLAVISFESL